MEKNNKKYIITGLTSLFLITLILLGLTYAYYRTRIVNNPEKTTVATTTKNLEVIYGDGTGVIAPTDGINPGWTAEKKFTVENKESEAASYSIILDNIVNNFVREEDWTYKLYKGTAIQTDDSNLISSGKIAVGTHQILIGQITTAAKTIDNYIIKVTYENSLTEDQSVDMDKKFSLRVNIAEATSTWESPMEGTLLAAIKSHNAVKSPSTTPGMTNSTSSEAVLAKAEDDYGISYYFRGNVKNNFVTYSNMCWRIVRIQGDGTIKIVLADDDHPCSANSDTGYSTANKKSALIGDTATQSFAYKYYETNLITSVNYNNGDLPALLNAWKNGDTYSYIESSTGNVKNGTFEQRISRDDKFKLAETEWCNDLSILDATYYDANSNVIEDPSQAVYADYSYGSKVRLDTTKRIGPTFKCNSQGINDSKALRITSSIGLLTADEVAYAGATKGTQNSTYYLITNANIFNWTMSPYSFKSGKSNQNANTTYIWHTSTLGYLTDNATVNYKLTVRPAVVLKQNLTIAEGGLGTQENPYVIN